MADWKDILSDKEELLTDEELLNYMHENMPEEEKHKVEKKVTGTFENDALDGLQEIKDKARLQSHVKQLHQKLPQLLRHKKKRLEKTHLKDFQWIILALVLLLIICLLTYIVLYFV